MVSIFSMVLNNIQLSLVPFTWIDNIKNGIVSSQAVVLLELRNRSDTGQANSSPQTTILPAVRVPSNCQRNFNLLAFDPDGDEVKCRYGITTEECNQCTPPSVLSLSSTCTLSFSPTNSSNEGPYAVQLMMEDFPRQQITLFQTNGSQVVKTINDPISKTSIQFVLRVDPVVPSCIEGLYLPRFLPPTPANRAQLYVSVSQTLEISINAEANNSIISELLFSGPHNANKTSSGAGQFILRWTPSENEDGESHPICFVVQAISNSSKYHSELRCVIVTVGNATTTTPTQPTTAAPTTTTLATTTSTIPPPVTTPDDTTSSPTSVTEVLNLIVVVLKTRLSSSSPLSVDELRTTVIQQLKAELERRGLPSDITLRLVNSLQLGSTTTATPVVST